MLKEFRAFLMRGNILDLAVGIVLGVAFGKIVTSFINDILMPPIGLLLGNVDFSDLFINLSGKPFESLAAAKAAAAPTINYGSFINTIIEFIIIGFAVFILLKQVNRMFPKPTAAPATKECPYCKSSINLNATRCPSCTSQLS